MIKIKDLSLDELYARPKITPSVEAAIKEKEDFSRIQPKYCEAVCKLCDKNYHSVDLEHKHIDVLIVQDHTAYPDDRNPDASKIERKNLGIVYELCKRNLVGLSWVVTSVLKCNLYPADIIKGKPPTTTKLLKCKPYLMKEIELCKPKVIICMGVAAAKALYGVKGSNYTMRGEIHNNVVYTLHPKVATMIRQNASGKMWGPDTYEIIERDFNKAGKIARGELTVPTLDEGIKNHLKDIMIANNIDDVRAMCDLLLHLPDNHIISFDLETTSLDPWAEDARILTAQFGCRSAKDGKIKSFVIPLWHRENNAYNPDNAWNYVKCVLESNKSKITHNGKFDILYTFVTKGVRVKNVIFDTLLALHAMNSGAQGTYSLKTAVWDFLPSSGLGGYEDKLPKLDKKNKDKKEEEGEDADTELEEV